MIKYTYSKVVIYVKCLKCGEEVSVKEKFCTHCGAEIDPSLEMPDLKSPATTEEITDFHENKIEDNEIATYTFDSEQSVKSRSRILTIVVTIIILVVGGAAIYFGLSFTKNLNNSINNTGNKKEVEPSKTDEEILSEYKAELNIFKDTGDVSKIQKLSASITKDDLDTVTKEIYKTWIDTLVEDNFNTLNDFILVYNTYSKYLDSLSNIEVIKNTTKEELKNSLDLVSSSYQELYTNVVELYNNKKYNEAYAKISSLTDNTKDILKTKVNYYQEQIVNDVLTLLKADIAKIENTINEQNKINKYAQIIIVINTYDTLYNNLNLKDVDTYKALLSNYEALNK